MEELSIGFTKNTHTHTHTQLEYRMLIDDLAAFLLRRLSRDIGDKGLSQH